MRADQPHAAVWLDIPRSTRLRAKFTVEGDIHVMFGDQNDEMNMVFERPAMARLVEVAGELLAVARHEDKASVPGLVTRENGAFMQEMRQVGELLGVYTRWALDSDSAGDEAFPFTEQMLLSARLAALGQTVRELAYAHMTSVADRGSSAPGGAQAEVGPVGGSPSARITGS